jgi:thiamine biosynthesis protein ThiI
VRYERQEGLVDQEKISRTKAAIAGLGGLGNPAAAYLALAGVGRLALIDNDAVEEGNLNRQFLFRAADAGRPKAEVAAERIREMNPDVAVETHGEISAGSIAGAGVVLDCLDNWESRRRLWSLAFSAGVPVVHGAADGWSGHVAVFRGENDAAPFLGKSGRAGQIIGAAAGETGSRMALEALKVLSGGPAPKMVSFDHGEPSEFSLGDRGWTHIIVRFSEIWLKSRATRRKLLGILSRNMARAAGEEPEFRRTRLFLNYAPEKLAPLSRVFGVASFSPALEVPLDGLEERFGGFARRSVRGRRFRVTVRRAWKGYPKKSPQLERELGAIADRYGTVDLTGYEVELGVEIHEGVAYLFDRRLKGPGGLPYGSEGRALALFSGGIDSPVAAWMLARRGAGLELLFLNPLGPVLESRVRGVFETLRPWLPGAELKVVDIQEEVERIRAEVKEGMRQTVLKRFLYRVAAEVARELECTALVTGENLGQVSSQTLQSLTVIDGAVKTPVFRPLIGMDKEEIVALARRIGTFKVSSKLKEFCSLEGHSNASPGVGETLRAELDFDHAAVASRLRASRSVELGLSPPDGVGLEVVRVWEGVPKLDASKRYLFVCKEGSRAAEEAHRARASGMEAYALGCKEARKRGLMQ